MHYYVKTYRRPKVPYYLEVSCCTYWKNFSGFKWALNMYWFVHTLKGKYKQRKLVMVFLKLPCSQEMMLSYYFLTLSLLGSISHDAVMCATQSINDEACLLSKQFLHYCLRFLFKPLFTFLWVLTLVVSCLAGMLKKTFALSREGTVLSGCR